MNHVKKLKLFTYLIKFECFHLPSMSVNCIVYYTRNKDRKEMKF